LFNEADYERTLHDQAVQQIADLAAKYEKAGVTVKPEVAIANDVGMEILRIGDRYGTDLIVIATHGMTGWREFAVGSVAEKVVRLARCSVLVLKAPRAAC
jgi:nucleotide-binding universal stress UspA family protein